MDKEQTHGLVYPASHALEHLHVKHFRCCLGPRAMSVLGTESLEGNFDAGFYILTKQRHAYLFREAIFNEPIHFIYAAKVVILLAFSKRRDKYFFHFNIINLTCF